MQLSVTQAASRYRLSPEHLRYLARRGKVRAQQFGQTWVIDEKSLLKYLASDRRPGRQPKGGRRSRR